VNLSATESAQLRELIHELCGLALSEEKSYLLRHRLGPVVRAAGCASFADFLAKLAGPAGKSLREPIIEAITTKETSFFRDRHPFEVFRKNMLPELASLARRRRAARRTGPVRIWCAAVATGQEAYSLAMLVDDYLSSPAGSDLQGKDFAIVGTDISTEALDSARAATYSDREVTRDVPHEFRERYLHKSKSGWVVVDRLRGMMELRKVNLMESFSSLGPVDLIFCRNVLIYFDESARRRICSGFAELLQAGGFLVLGTVENLYGISNHFVSERLGNTLVYRKI
jgi:chemotaxis protein methyltransferase CheR